MRGLMVVLVVLVAVAAFGFWKRRDATASEARFLAAARATLVSACKRKSTAELQGFSGERIDRFCRCSTDGIVATLGVAGLRGMNDSGRISPEEAAQMEQAAVACQPMLKAR